MSYEKTTDNKMATAPVGKLMLTIGLPIVFSMMLQAAYNIVDSAYLSNMKEAGEEALTALGLAFPVQLLMVAMAVGTGVGANALLSKAMGQGNVKKASQAAGNAILMGGVIFVIFLLFGFFGVPVYVNSQNAGGNISETVLQMTVDYLQICCCISFGIIFFSIYEKLLQAMGRSLYSTIAQVTGAVINIVLDPIMIYGWLGCPEMGVKGAAYATVIGQIASAVMVFIFHMKLDTEIDRSFRYLKPDFRIIRETYAIGLPAIISQALLTVMTYGLNIILGQLPEVGENAVTVYGLYCKIQQMIIFAAVGVPGRHYSDCLLQLRYEKQKADQRGNPLRYGLYCRADADRACHNRGVCGAVYQVLLPLGCDIPDLCGLYADRVSRLYLCGNLHRLSGCVPGH